jgi:hypothetical protein
MRTGILFSLLLVCALTPDIFGHEVRPAYLELRQRGAESYDVLWKIPARGESARLALYVQFPPDCQNLTRPIGSFINNSYSERRQIRRAGGLSNGMIRVAGLSGVATDVLVRVERLDGTSQVARLTPSSDSFVVEAAPRRLEIVRAYLTLGVEHILTGFDHLLFILGLLLLVRGAGRLLRTVTAFTIAHSVTLSAATLGFVHVPQAPVEAIIALSIIFVAVEILRSYRNAPGAPPTLAQRQPWLIAFTFGLLHGLGFAGGLSEAGLPSGHIPLALLNFSIGVEVGHFGFIAVVLALIAAAGWMMRRFPAQLLDPQRLATLRLLSPYAIGAIATFWLMQRIAAF